MSIAYRREIDGLRALAVVPVIFFHAGLKVFGGGYVGVDVFFVISGYLITSLILAEREAGRFTIVSFYERRMRRILPALFLVTLACLPVAWLLLLPADLKSFSDSVAAVSVFSSNILFWKTSSYFDTVSELKPLLHTWSLAVEEQYYLLFPLVLLAVLKLGRRWTMPFFACAAALSLAAAQIASARHPEFTFFVLPTRGWELLIGVLIALYVSRDERAPPPRILVEVAGLVGLALIGYAAIFFAKTTPSPSMYTLVPTIGTGLVILYADANTIIGRLLGHKLLVGIGLISYSAYLWHQPVLAFARTALLSEPDVWDMLGLIVLVFALSFLSWKYVEVPFRDRKRMDRRTIFRFSAAGTALFMMAGIAGHVSGGFPGRFDPETVAFLNYYDDTMPAMPYSGRMGMYQKMRLDCAFFDFEAFRIIRTNNNPRASIPSNCYRRDPAYAHAAFIWGDSHAQHLNYGVKVNLPKTWQLMQVASTGCGPTSHPQSEPLPYCAYSNAFAMNAIRAAKPDVVVIAQRGDPDVDDIRRIARLVRQMGVPRVIVIGPAPQWIMELPKIVVRRLWHNPARHTFGHLEEPGFCAVWGGNAALTGDFGLMKL